MSDFGSVSPLSELLSRRYEIFGDFLLFEWLAVFVCPARFRDFLFFSMLLFEWSPNNKVRDVDRVQSKKGTPKKRERSKEILTEKRKEETCVCIVSLFFFI